MRICYSLRHGRSVIAPTRESIVGTNNINLIDTNKKGHDTMKKIITLNLFKERRLEQEYKGIKAILKDSEYIFSLDSVKTVISPTRFTRETDEYKFNLDIKERKATYLLKEKNMSFDIDVEKIEYKKVKNTIILGGNCSVKIICEFPLIK